MFPEYRQLITQLKSENAHFSALFQRHNALDQQIQNMEAGIVRRPATTWKCSRRKSCN